LNASPVLVALQDGLERLFEAVQSDEFYFVVNGEQMKSTIAEASLISPTIHQQLRSFPDIHTFRIDDTDFSAKHFSHFLEFVHSNIITGFSKEEQTSFLSICGHLGNTRLTFLLIDSLHYIESSQESAAFDVLEIDADVCASNFYDYSVEMIKCIDKGMLHEIMSSGLLKLESEDVFLMTLINLGSDYFEFWQYIEVCNLTGDGIVHFVENLPFDELTESIWKRIVDHLRGSKLFEYPAGRYRSPVGFESLIVKYYPTILNDFANKTCKLLYRGSRDSFRGSNFHGKCDGQSYTLTLIETMNGFIFGGFTPLAWDSTTNGCKSDSSQQSFVFTLKNAENIKPLKFKLSNVSYAIYSYSNYGPTFGGGNYHDIHVADNCNANTNSYTNLGYGYVNDTGIDGMAVFTGEQFFTVKEIEVFAITL
jgi:hypothetical protein